MTTSAIDLATLAPGFGDSVHEAQQAFQSVLWALSRPGLPRSVAPVPTPDGLDAATTALLMTLCDHETPVHLAGRAATRAAADHMRFHTGAPIAASCEACVYAVVDAGGAATLLPELPMGEDRYPDRSATLFVMVESFDGGTPVRLTGPGVDGAVTIAPVGLGTAFWAARADNFDLFPLGVDIVLTAGTVCLGLPRTTRATVEG